MPRLGALHRALRVAKGIEYNHRMYLKTRAKKRWHGVYKCHLCDLSLHGSAGHSYLKIRKGGETLDAVPPCTTRQWYLYD